jgi:hypothetical protein
MTNRIGFAIPENYELRDHIIWSKFNGGATSVSGTSDVKGITPHQFTIRPWGKAPHHIEPQRYALRCYVNGQIRSYSGSNIQPDKIFDTLEEAQYFATWHSEGIYAKSN